MPIKLPYDQIVIEANKLYRKAMDAKSIQELKYWYDRYTEYLDACGWTPGEFQEEEIRRINEGWETKSD